MDPWFQPELASEATDLAWWDGFSRLADNPKGVLEGDDQALLLDDASGLADELESYGSEDSGELRQQY